MIMRLLRWISVVGLSMVIAGSVVYVFGVLPARHDLREERVVSLAQQVDTLIKVRAASLWAVTSLLNTQNLRTDANVERSLTALREFSPDFLSLEVLDDQGEILAMLGDIPLSEAARRGASEEIKDLATAQDSAQEWFSDDPEGNSYYITIRHTAQDGRKWFARGRFSRNQLELALGSASRIGIAALRNRAREVPLAVSSKTTQASLSYPGWSVMLEERPWSARGSRKWEMGAVSLALLATIVLLLVRYRQTATRAVVPALREKISLDRSDEPLPLPVEAPPLAVLPESEVDIWEGPSHSDEDEPQEGERSPISDEIASEETPCPWAEASSTRATIVWANNSLDEDALGAAEDQDVAVACPDGVTAHDTGPDELDGLPETMEIQWNEPAAWAEGMDDVRESDQRQAKIPGTGV
jgi:hypothetical protein